MISNLGEVKSLRSGSNLKGFYRGRGKYKCVEIEGKKNMIHRLTAIAFIDNPENKRCVNHKDGNKLNNRVDNLKWCTDRENKDHAKKAGLYPSGENHGRSKLTEKDVEEIRGKYTWYDRNKHSQYKLAEEYGVSRSAIQKVLDRTNWSLSI